MIRIIATLFFSFLVSFLLSPILRKFAVRWGVLDHPAARKLQKEPVPLLGGAAVYLGFILGMVPVLFVDKFDRGGLGLLFGATLIFIVSLIDDKKNLPATVRIAAQLIAAGIMLISGVFIQVLPNNSLGHAGNIALTLMWILGITNAFNYLDGIDGLCSGLAVISSVFFFLVFHTTGQLHLIFFPLAMIGACMGFLPSNLKKNKMFLGDSGSMFIGFVMSGIALLGTWASDNIIKISVPILILGVPIFDMTFTTIMRVKEKKIKTVIQWLEYAGRDHFHHYLMDLGLHARGAALFIFAVSVSMGISAFIIAKSDKAYFGFLTVVKGAIMFGLISVLMVLGRRLHKQNEVKERMGY